MSENSPNVAKAPFDQPQTISRLRRLGPATRDREGIAIEADNIAAPREDRLRIAAASIGAIEIEPALPHREGLHHLIQQHRNMARPLGGHSGAPRSGEASLR